MPVAIFQYLIVTKRFSFLQFVKNIDISKIIFRYWNMIKIYFDMYEIISLNYCC